jgi:hypothetical protein
VPLTLSLTPSQAPTLTLTLTLTLTRTQTFRWTDTRVCSFTHPSLTQSRSPAAQLPAARRPPQQPELQRTCSC